MVSGCFPPGERATGTHWKGGWVGPRAGLDAVVKRKFPNPCQESNPSRQTRSLVAIPTELRYGYQSVLYYFLLGSVLPEYVKTKQ
jgi:hypothetical protein